MGSGFGRGTFRQEGRAIGAVLVLFVVLTCGSGPAAAGEKHREMARKISAEGVPNMAEVTPRYRQTARGRGPALYTNADVKGRGRRRPCHTG